MDTREELRKFFPTRLAVSDWDLSLFLSSLTLRRLSKGDRFFNADQAKEYGLIDRVLDSH